MSENLSAAAFAAEAGETPTVVNNGDTALQNAMTGQPTFTNTTNPSQKFYTEDDLARIRAQEKDKLYPQIDKLKEELDAIKREKEEQKAREAAEIAKQEKEASLAEKKRQEEEMELRQLLSQKEQEWADRLEAERQEREKAFALLDRERKFAEVTAYKSKRIQEEQDNIIPELIDLVQGDTATEIEASVQSLKERSSKILEAAQQAMQTARKDMTGTRPTAPPAGPLDINTGNRQFTAEDISAMGMNEYAKLRTQLLSDRALGREQGLFG